MTATILAFVLTSVAEAATPRAPSVDSDTVVVEASGTVPGFTQAQLADYLADRMQEETAAAWHFTGEKPGAAPALNRVVWSFETLRVEWKPGSHRGFPSPGNSVSRVSAEAKLYLNNDYQMTMITQPSISGGYDDKALAEIAHRVARALFVENKADTSSR